MGYDIGPKIGVDGEAEFRAQLNQITSIVKTLGTEMQVVSAQFDKQQDSEEALTAKNKVLTREIEEQRKKLELLRQGVQKSTEKYGEANKYTQEWKQTVNRAEAELIKMENQLRDNNSALDEMKNGLGENAESLKAVADREEELRRQINQINTVVKTLGTEMQEVTSRFDKQKVSSEALTEKNKVLTKEIEEQRKKLELLKRGVQDSAEQYGDADEKTLKWKQELNLAAAELNKMENQLKQNTAALDSLENGLEDSDNALEETTDSIENMEDSLGDAEKSASSFGDVFKASLAADFIVGAVQSIIGAFKQWSEESREVRKIMASLEVSSQKAGYGADQTKESYLQLYGVLADNQTAATTTANLQALGLEQERLRQITDGVIGAWATYGDSIPIDGLAEAINETAKAGQVTGTFADVLNWAGTSEDDFNEKLKASKNEADRVNLIMQELADQGLMEAGKAWQENNQSLVESNRAMAEYESVTAELGAMAEPVFTAIREGINGVFASLLQLTSGVDFEAIAEGIRSFFEYFSQLSSGLQNGTIGITDAIGMMNEKAREITDGLIAGLQEKLPSLKQAGQEMLSYLASGIATMLPAAFEEGAQAVGQFTQGLLQELPGLITGAGEVINTLLDAFLTALPQMLETGVEMTSQLAAGIWNNTPAILEAIKNAILQLLMTILSHMPEILQTGIELMGKLAAGIIQAIPQVVAAIPQVIVGIQSKFSATDWAEVGINIIKGIKNGVVNAAKLLIDAVKDVANQALEGLKRFLGIHSPSAVMRDEVGRQITAGIAEGILAGKDSAKKSAEKVSQELVEAAQQKLSYYKSFNRMILGVESEFWKEINDQTNEGIRAKIDADKKYLDAKRKLNRESLIGDFEKELEMYQEMTVRTTNNATRNILESLSQDSNVPTYANGTAAAYQKMTEQLGNLRVVLQDGTVVGKLSPAINREIGGYARMDERYYT